MIILGPTLTTATDRALEFTAQIVAGNGSHGLPLDPKDYQQGARPDAFEGGPSFALSVMLSIRAIRYGLPKETTDDIRLGFKESRALMMRITTGDHTGIPRRTYWHGCAKLGAVLSEGRLIAKTDGVYVYHNDSDQSADRA